MADLHPLKVRSQTRIVRFDEQLSPMQRDATLADLTTDPWQRFETPDPFAVSRTLEA